MVCQVRRPPRFLDVGGVSLRLTEWARKTGIAQELIRSRLERGWAPQRAVSVPATPKAKLTPALAEDLRSRHASGETQRALARELSLHHDHVRKVIAGLYWKPGFFNGSGPLRPGRVPIRARPDTSECPRTP